MVARPAVLPYSSTTITMWVFSCCIWRIKVAHRLGFRHEQNRAHQLPHRAARARGLVHFEHVAHVHEPDHLVDIPLVHRDARILLVDHQRAELFERGIGRDGDDVGPRRHYLPHYFVAELHHRLDQLAVVLLDQAFFGAGGNQRFDVLGGRGRGFLGRVVVRQLDQRLEEVQGRHERPGHPGQPAQRRNQRNQPLPARAPVEQLRQRRRWPAPWSARPPAPPARNPPRSTDSPPEVNQAQYKMPISTSRVCLISEKAPAPSSVFSPSLSSRVFLKNSSEGRSRVRSRRLSR